jgi:hypothetical protein
VLERSHDVALLIMGADATVERTVVRGTLPNVADGIQGDGIWAIDEQSQAGRTKLTLRSSVVDRNTRCGVLVAGSDALIEGVIVRDTQPEVASGLGGEGIGIQFSKTPSTATLRGSLVDGNVESAVYVGSSTATIDGMLLRGTRAREDGAYGDGLVANDIGGGGANVEVAACAIEGNARAGITNFSANVSVRASVLDRNPIDLNGEAKRGPFSFENLGGNVCKTATGERPCQVLSSSLAPPAPLPARR